MRWVFIRPLNRSPYYDPEIQEPLGLEYLAAYRRAKGDSILLLDCALNSMSDVKLARRAVSFQPDALGFSIMTAQELDSVRTIYNEVQKVLVGQKILWLAGGNFISTETHAALKDLPDCFHLVLYEGEAALETLVQVGIGSKKRHVPVDVDLARVYYGAAIGDLDSLPFPERPFANIIVESEWAFNMQGSRGCCGACHYCSSPGMAEIGNNRWRGRSPTNIVEEIAHLNQNYGAHSFNFVDEDFLGPPQLARQRVYEFAKILRQKNLRISFSLQVRPNVLTDEIVDVLVESGLIFMFMGIESDSKDDYHRWGRHWFADPWHFVKRLQSQGVLVNAGVLLFHSHSTLDSISRFAKTLRHHRLLDYRTAINRLDAMPGSVFFKKGIEDGLFLPEARGPQSIPFICSKVESLYNDFKVAIAPLGPTSMHALCALPPVLARRLHDNRLQETLEHLMDINELHDAAVTETLFSLLITYYQGGPAAGAISVLRERNLDIALDGAKRLVKHGFAASVDELREAIRIDSEL